jgi:hypothetical protein
MLKLLRNKKSEPRTRLALFEKPKLSYRNHIHYTTSASATEFNCACSECKQSVILTATYVLAWVKMCSALTDQDLASIYFLSTKALDAKVLWI